MVPLQGVRRTRASPRPRTASNTAGSLPPCRPPSEGHGFPSAHLKPHQPADHEWCKNLNCLLLQRVNNVSSMRSPAAPLPAAPAGSSRSRRSSPAGAGGGRRWTNRQRRSVTKPCAHATGPNRWCRCPLVHNYNRSFNNPDFLQNSHGIQTPSNEEAYLMWELRQWQTCSSRTVEAESRTESKARK